MFELFPGYDEAPMTEMAMHLPMFSHGSAFAPDWNDDGVLDLWHHNHYSFSHAESRWSDPSIEEKGPSDGPIGGCMVDWDAVLRDGETGAYYPANDGDGFIEWADANTDEKCFDVHSTSFIDIDGDGLKDLFLTTGGGRGKGTEYYFDNILFWGVATNSSLGFRLVGGRDAAAAAGLRGRIRRYNERGRHQYWLDVDGDGLLDVIFLNKERSDDEVLPGQLFRNRNGRSFKRIKRESGFAEFAHNMVLTDVDGDGMARELVVPSSCQSRTEPSAPPQNDVCERSPRGSMSVYRLSPENLLVRETMEPRPPTHDYIRTISSGDFDFDGLADIATLWGRDVLFHLSSARQQRCHNVTEENEHLKCLLTLGPADASLHLETCGISGAVSIRFADFNLDGRLDMLAVCKDPGLHSIYEQMPDGEWREMQTPRGKPMEFGALNALDLMLGGDDFCKDVPVAKKSGGLPNNCLARFSPEECANVRYRHQWLICNLRHKFPHTPNATALGATVADIDNDGFVDVIVGYRLGAMLMLRNTLAGPRTKFLAVRLDKSAGAPMAVGAIVKLTASRMGPHLNETTTQVRVLSSLSHETDAEGGNEDRLIFGLGRRGRPKTLSVMWPHCCEETVIMGRKANLWKWLNNMSKPYEVSPPAECDRSCFL